MVEALLDSSKDEVVLQETQQQQQQQKDYVLNRTVADFLAGSFAGVCGKIVEYPFDTVKVRLQCQDVDPRTVKMTTARCAVDIFTKEGVNGFYRGLSTPLVGSIMENIVLFVAYGRIQKLLQGGTDQPLSIAQLSLAGGMAGSVVSAVLTPVELIKCKIQMHASLYKGAIDCIVKTIKSTGPVGLYKGHAATFARETFGGAAWFGVYELACRTMSKDGNKDALGAPSLMLAGALSGIAYNTVLFPMDVVKSQIQADNSPDKSYVKRFKALYSAEGIKGLYRGYGITFVRAIPANAIILASFELATRSLRF